MPNEINNKKFGINLEFTERRRYEDHISDIQLFTLYATIIIKEDNFSEKFKNIKKDFLKLIEKYE